MLLDVGSGELCSLLALRDPIPPVLKGALIPAPCPPGRDPVLLPEPIRSVIIQHRLHEFDGIARELLGFVPRDHLIRDREVIRGIS